MATAEQCRRAMELHSERLTNLPHVEGLGVRELETSDPDREPEMCVAVYVREKVALEELAEKDVIPKIVQLNVVPDEAPIEIPTRVFEIGELKLQ